LLKYVGELSAVTFSRRSNAIICDNRRERIFDKIAKQQPTLLTYNYFIARCTSFYWASLCHDFSNNVYHISWVECCLIVVIW